MPTDHDHDRVLALCREIADWLHTVALDEGEDLTPTERRALIEIALAVERRAKVGDANAPE